ncbi:MAG TPA: hypothetical protein VKS01_06355, partial [Bryobacteraceae bacterium]|nr:hypothetical protein [Bryobacteraceae bacterium]
EHGSENRAEFDELYRDHLSNVYRALGQPPPEALAQPVVQSQPGEFREPPCNEIHAILDGEITSFFEWQGAGRYRPDLRSGAMHADPPFRELLYGVSGGQLFVRLDGAPEAGFKIEFESGAAETRQVRGKVVELAAHQSGSRFRIKISRNGLPEETVPAEAWIEL